MEGRRLKLASIFRKPPYRMALATAAPGPDGHQEQHGHDWLQQPAHSVALIEMNM
jgi:hypothetical protein